MVSRIGGFRPTQVCSVRLPASAAAALLVLLLLTESASASLSDSEEAAEGAVVAEVDAGASISRSFPRLARATGTGAGAASSGGGAAAVGGGGRPHERRFQRADRPGDWDELVLRPSPDELRQSLGPPPHSQLPPRSSSHSFSSSYSSYSSFSSSFVETSSDTPDSQPGCPEAHLDSDADDILFVLPAKSSHRVSFTDTFQLKRSESCEGDPEQNTVVPVQASKHLDSWRDAQIVFEISKPLPTGKTYICPVGRSHELDYPLWNKASDGDGDDDDKIKQSPKELAKTEVSQTKGREKEVALPTKPPKCLAYISYQSNALRVVVALQKLLDLGIASNSQKILQRTLDIQDNFSIFLICSIVLGLAVVWMLVALASLAQLLPTLARGSEPAEEETQGTPCIHPFPVGERTRGCIMQMFSFVMGNVGLVGVALRCMFVDVQPWFLDTILVLDVFVGSVGLLLLGQELYVQQLYDVVAGQGRCLLNGGGVTVLEVLLILGFVALCCCLAWGWQQLDSSSTLFGASSGFLAIVMAIMRLRQTRLKRARGLCEVSLPELSEILLSMPLGRGRGPLSSSSSSGRRAPLGTSGLAGAEEDEEDEEERRRDETEGKKMLLLERVGASLCLGDFCRSCRQGVDPLEGNDEPDGGGGQGGGGGEGGRDARCEKESKMCHGTFSILDLFWQPHYVYKTSGSRWAFANLTTILGMFLLLFLHLAHLKLYFQTLTPQLNELKPSIGVLVPSFSPEVRSYNFIYESFLKSKGTKSASFSFFSNGEEETVRRQVFQVDGAEAPIASTNSSDIVRLHNVGGRSDLRVDVKVASGKNELSTDYDVTFTEVTYHIGTILITSESVMGRWKRCLVMASSWRGAISYPGFHKDFTYEFRVYPYVRGVPISLADIPADGREMITVVHPLEEYVGMDMTLKQKCQSACRRLPICKVAEATEKGCYLGVLPSHPTTLDQNACEAVHEGGVPLPSPDSPLHRLVTSRNATARLCEKADPRDAQAEKRCVSARSESGSVKLNLEYSLQGLSLQNLEHNMKFEGYVQDKFMREPAVAHRWDFGMAAGLPFPSTFLLASTVPELLSMRVERVGRYANLILDYNPKQFEFVDTFDVLVVPLGGDWTIDYTLKPQSASPARTWKHDSFENFGLAQICNRSFEFRDLSLCDPNLKSEPREAYFIIRVNRWLPDTADQALLGGVWNSRAVTTATQPRELTPFYLRVSYAALDPPAVLVLRRGLCYLELPGERGSRYHDVLLASTLKTGLLECKHGIGLWYLQGGCTHSARISYPDWYRLSLMLEKAPLNQVQFLEAAAIGQPSELHTLLSEAKLHEPGCDGLSYALDLSERRGFDEALELPVQGSACILWRSLVLFADLAPSLWTTELRELLPKEAVRKFLVLAIESQSQTTLRSTMQPMFDAGNWGPDAPALAYEATMAAIRHTKARVVEKLLSTPEAWNYRPGGDVAYDAWISRSLQGGCQGCIEAILERCNATHDGSDASDGSRRAEICRRWKSGQKSKELTLEAPPCMTTLVKARDLWSATEVWWSALGTYEALSIQPGRLAEGELWPYFGKLPGLKYIDIDFIGVQTWNSTLMTPWAPKLRKVKVLHDLHDLQPSEDNMDVLGELLRKLEPATSLRALAFNSGRLTLKDLAALGASPLLNHLATLDLSHNPDLGAPALKACLDFANLGSKVDVSPSEDHQEDPDSNDPTKATTTKKTETLKSLLLEDIGLTEDSFADVGEAKLLKTLQHLDVSGNPLGPLGVQSLFKRLENSAVRSLAIRATGLDGATLSALGKSPFLRSLAFLDLSENAELGLQDLISVCKLRDANNNSNSNNSNNNNNNNIRSNLIVRASPLGAGLAPSSLAYKSFVAALTKTKCGPSLEVEGALVTGPNWAESPDLKRLLGPEEPPAD